MTAASAVSRETPPGTPRSRSKSPHHRRGATATTADANSSVSSLDDIEQDILTDRAGLMDDLSETQRRMHSSKELCHVPVTINERLSEDTLEDIHAFSDVVRSSNASRVSSVAVQELEPLDEMDEMLEEDEEGDEEEGEDGSAVTTQVILTNMENLDLQQGSAAPRAGGESSLAEGEGPSSAAPSARTG
jgi:hypothetical protein